ncbi:hypothetical protein BC833DRAFT_624035, partial [Globomyces pollinis-pini]
PRAVGVKNPAPLNGVCGGFLGVQCVQGLKCELPANVDPTVSISDEQGVCVPL